MDPCMCYLTGHSQGDMRAHMGPPVKKIGDSNYYS